MTNVLSFQLKRTESWRERTAERFSNDARNLAAVKLLRELADDKIMETEASDRYERLYEEIDPSEFGEVVSDAMAEIGFSWFPKTADEVILDIVGRLERHATVETA